MKRSATQGEPAISSPSSGVVASLMISQILGSLSAPQGRLHGIKQPAQTQVGSFVAGYTQASCVLAMSIRALAVWRRFLPQDATCRSNVAHAGDCAPCRAYEDSRHRSPLGAQKERCDRSPEVRVHCNAAPQLKRTHNDRRLARESHAGFSLRDSVCAHGAAQWGRHLSEEWRRKRLPLLRLPKLRLS